MHRNTWSSCKAPRKGTISADETKVFCQKHKWVDAETFESKSGRNYYGCTRSGHDYNPEFLGWSDTPQEEDSPKSQIKRAMERGDYPPPTSPPPHTSVPKAPPPLRKVKKGVTKERSFLVTLTDDEFLNMRESIVDIIERMDKCIENASQNPNDMTTTDPQ
jgi:hypothetical protein